MGRGYPLEFRGRVLDLIATGRKVADVARDLGVSDQTIYNWRKQSRIDRGLEPGLTSIELEELAKARRRIAELEAELANAIFEYIEIFHNRKRRHSSLGMLTPSEYEKMAHPSEVA